MATTDCENGVGTLVTSNQPADDQLGESGAVADPLPLWLLFLLICVSLPTSLLLALLGYDDGD